MGLSRTYSHLAGQRRLPSQYEIASSRLLYYPTLGFAVDTPGADWYRRHQAGSPLVAADWDQFADPRATTYSGYTALQREREVFAAQLGGERDELAPAWRGALERVIGPLRHPCHALMMLASYLGAMAPSGRIAIAAAFQAADEIRRVHRLSHRLRSIAPGPQPEIAAEALAAWEREPAWQPLRELCERALVAYDWGECAAALGLAIKPAFDSVVGSSLAAVARRAGDDTTARILGSLHEDAAWHRAWMAALVATAIAQRPGNRDVLIGWSDKWRPLVDRAVGGMAEVIGDPAAAERARQARDRFVEEALG